MKRVYICSPYKGDIMANTAKAQRYCRFAYSQGIIGIAPHLIFPQFLQEEIREEREAGIVMGLELLVLCEELWCFGNKLSDGMQKEMNFAIKSGIPVRYFSDTCQEVGQCGRAT